MTDLQLSIQFFLQLAVILATCRLMGWALRRLGQTQVVSEMIAGVALGPSLLGMVAPSVSERLFPKTQTIVLDGAQHTLPHPSMSILFVAAQLGLILYMFLVGLEFDIGLIQKRASTAVFVSLAGIVAPFVLGATIAFWLHASGGFFGSNVQAPNGALYMGAAMCITAFPMLARIIYEAGLSKTSMGTLALAAGVSDDAVAWCLLAIVLAVQQNSPSVALLAIGGGLIYGVLMLTAGRRLLAPLGRQTERTGEVSPTQFGIMATVFVLGAWYTDAIGIFAVFGAFIAGVAMPRGKFAEIVQHKSTLLVTTVLLPLFFVYSGLNTKIGLLNTPQLWAITGLICLVAILGKGVACALAARAGGEGWRESWAIGTLMNSRGLMELIILNMGLKAGVITQTLFTMMVIMAIVTTLMASPLYRWIYGRHVPITAMP